jgi:hypothetical protein
MPMSVCRWDLTGAQGTGRGGDHDARQVLRRFAARAFAGMAGSANRKRWPPCGQTVFRMELHKHARTWPAKFALSPVVSPSGDYPAGTVVTPGSCSRSSSATSRHFGDPRAVVFAARYGAFRLSGDRRSATGRVSACRRVRAVSTAPDDARSTTQQRRTAQCAGGLEQVHLVGVGARTSPEGRFASSLMRVNSSARKRRLKSMISDGAPATNGPRCVSGSPRGCPA